MKIEDVQVHFERVIQEVERAVVGKRAALELILSGILADGHILLEDYPGLAKTLIARSLAQSMKLVFARVQFTPDLMPSDITGSSIYNQQTGEFQMRRGPIFTNLLLGDEINRSPPKTQAALLEGMQERQVTIDGLTMDLPRPFLVMATQNPIEYEGTYPLPEAQLDRFLMRASVGYPEPADEERMVRERHLRRRDEVGLSPVLDGPTLLACQAAVEGVVVNDDLFHYIVQLVGATRQSPRVLVGASPRGTLALLRLSRARAALMGRDFVIPEDIQAVAVPALAHRLTLRPELWAQHIQADDVVVECLRTIPVPPTLPPEMMRSVAPAAEGEASSGMG
ncbi:MAG: MoxR family ATPase [Candidatus Dormiibacterota bacterium]